MLFIKNRVNFAKNFAIGLTEINTNMNKLVKKIMGSSFLVGMASIFCPSIIEIEPMKCDNKTASENIAQYWKNVGSYITKAYETTTKGSGRDK